MNYVLSISDPYLNSIHFDLESFFGDADLLLSTTKVPTLTDFEQESRRMENFDRVSVKRTDNYYLNRTFYISVYSNCQSGF